jgi:ubiquinone/menaquinone biosynthesis C-methylase UbiE
MAPQASEKRHWQNWDEGDAARRIDRYWLSNEGPWRRLLARDMAAVFPKAGPVLEVGCGSGLIYAEMLKNRIVTPTSYTGGDVSRNMLAIARERFPQVRFRELDIFHLDLGDRSQPNVICIHVIQHLPYYDKAVLELMRVAGSRLYLVSWFKPAGEDEIIFSEPSEQWNGQQFHNNSYSLPKFLDFILARSGRSVEGVRVQHLDGANYSICINFDRPQVRPRGLLSRLWHGRQTNSQRHEPKEQKRG